MSTIFGSSRSISESLYVGIVDGGDIVMNYAKFAFGYNATLDGNIQLENAFVVQPPEAADGGIEETLNVVALVWGPPKMIKLGILTQGNSVHICVKSTSYPRASTVVIESLTYTADRPSGGTVVLLAITETGTGDILTKFVMRNLIVTGVNASSRHSSKEMSFLLTVTWM